MTTRYPSSVLGSGSAVSTTFRRLLRQAVPRRMRARYHSLKERALIKRWYGDWLQLQNALASDSRTSVALSDAVLLIPSDTRTFSGGKGDEAMTIATITALRSAGWTGPIHALCENSMAYTAAKALGCMPLDIPQSPQYLRDFDEWLANVRPAVAIGIGADSIDGAYGVVGPSGMLAVLDLASRRGAKSIVTGFSVRERPDPAIAPFFRRLSRSVTLNVRDSVSMERVQAAYGVSGRQVSDTAFLLMAEKTPRIEPVEAWIRSRQEVGRVVVGINVHPMLFSADEREAREVFLKAFSAAVRSASGEREVSWVFVAHDYRHGDADRVLLEPLLERLAGHSIDAYEAYSTEYSAGELKALSSLFDGVVSARMHLAIASLGSGTPVLGIVYQGKFEGLLQHFDFPTWLALDPRTGENDFRTALIRFIDDLPVLRSQITQKTAQVARLAELNYEEL